MIERRQLDGKVTPEAAQFIQLDDLNIRMGKMVKLLEVLTENDIKRQQREPLGIFWDRVVNVTTAPVEVTIDAVSYTLVNDGPATVYTDTSQQVFTGASKAGLIAGESDNVQFGGRTRTTFWVATSSGTATLRIRGTR